MVGSKFSAFDTAGFPEVNVKYIEGSADWPREGQFTAFADSVFREDAVSAFFAPSGDVGSDAGPEKSLAEAVQGLIGAKVAGTWCGVVSRENDAAQAGGNYDEE